jgi:hypothetical protein
MAASLETVREKMKVEPTPENKGLILTLTITAYDNGVLSVDGRPVSVGDPTLNWLSAHEVMSIAMTEFYRRSKLDKNRASDVGAFWL